MLMVPPCRETGQESWLAPARKTGLPVEVAGALSSACVCSSGGQVAVDNEDDSFRGTRGTRRFLFFPTGQNSSLLPRHTPTPTQMQGGGMTTVGRSVADACQRRHGPVAVVLNQIAFDLTLEGQGYPTLTTLAPRSVSLAVLTWRT